MHAAIDLFRALSHAVLLRLRSLVTPHFPYPSSRSRLTLHVRWWHVYADREAAEVPIGCVEIYEKGTSPKKALLLSMICRLQVISLEIFNFTFISRTLSNFVN